MKIDRDNDELKEYLNNYPKVIPKYLLGLIDVEEYNENLRKQGVYDKVYQEYYKIRIDRLKSDDKIKFDRDEFNQWLEDNPNVRGLIE